MVVWRKKASLEGARGSRIFRSPENHGCGCIFSSEKLSQRMFVVPKNDAAISSCCLIFLAYLCFARYARCCYAVFVVPSGPRESYVEKSCTPLYSVAWQPFDRLLNGTRNRNVLF
jgi:hypothetical protein